MDRIKDIMHVHLTAYGVWITSKNNIYSLISSAVVKSGTRFFLNIYFALTLDIITRREDENVEDKIWIVVGSQNTFSAVNFIGEYLDDSIFITTNTYSRKSPFHHMTKLSFHTSLWYYYKLPYYFIKFCKEYGLVRTLTILDKLVNAIGLFEAGRKILKLGQPKMIIFANDHSLKSRSLLLAANSLDIKTIYVQHASVTECFPPLKFSLNLLEGSDALEKYQDVGPIDGVVKLVGMPKSDDFVSRRKPRRTIKNIGICGSLLDDVHQVSHVCSFLASTSGYQVSCRLHPRDDREIDIPETVEISDARHESIFDFIVQQDLLICGNTSTHLESVLLNVPSISYNMGSQDQMNDYYGYVANGLVDHADTPEELSSLIFKYDNDLSDIYLRAKRYCDTIDTPYDGRPLIYLTILTSVSRVSTIDRYEDA